MMAVSSFVRRLILLMAYEVVDSFDCSFSGCAFQFRAWSIVIPRNFVFVTVEMIVLGLFCYVSSELIPLLRFMYGFSHINSGSY